MRADSRYSLSRPICVIALWLTALDLAPSTAAAGPIGGNFEISGSNCRFPDAAHGLADGRYLVVWADYGETQVHGRFVTADGAVSGAPFRITEAPYGGLFPAVAYNANGDEFLVTWDDFGGRGERIHGQRVRARYWELAADFPNLPAAIKDLVFDPLGVCTRRSGCDRGSPGRSRGSASSRPQTSCAPCADGHAATMPRS